MPDVPPTHGGPTTPADPAATAFACADVALLRAAVRPPRPGAAPCAPTDLERLRAATGDALLREAIQVSSPSLSRVLDQVEAGEQVRAKHLRRAARAVTRYRLRMSDRATPFGLMAGVATATFAPEAAVRWGEQHRKAVSPGAEWLSGLVERLEQEPLVLRRLQVTTNDLCYERGSRLVLPYRSLAGTERKAPAQELSLRLSAVVRSVLEHADRPVSWTLLRQRVAAAHPQVATDEVDWLLTELVHRQILLTDLMPPADTEDPIAHILARIGGLRELPQTEELHAVRRELAQYAAAPLGAGQALWRQATERMRALYPTDRLVHVDLALDVDARLPQAVRQEVERAAQALWVVSAGRPGAANLRQYHEDFLERYGIGRAVPVLELLDPQTGLGAPAGYAVPRGTRRLRGGEPPDPRDATLLALAQQAAATGGREVVLDAELLGRLSGTGTPPPSLDLLAQLHADSTESLAAGEFILVATGTAMVAGATSGRFATLLRGPGGTCPAAAAAAAPCANPEAQRAQLTFRTLKPHTADITGVPRLLHHTITLGQFADRGAPGALELADLAVVADHDRLAVVSRRLGREIVPTLPSMVATDAHAPNAARLLDEITRSGDGAWPRWRWGAAESLPYLPRVRYGRSILSLARWQPEDPRLREAPDSDSARDDAWQERFDAWRKRWDVPQLVQSVTGDHRITIDVTDPHQLDLLRNEWTQQPDSYLQELPPGGTGWLSPQGRANEIAFSLLRRGPGTRSTPTVAPARPRTPHGPGSHWLYAKLYCPAQHQDDVLTRHLPDLLARLPEAVDRWFFIRYRDPDPHLRLRFHGDPPRLAAELLPALAAWTADLADAGYGGRLLLDGYDPELERYGGPEAMAAAERVFAADSRACVTQLQSLTQGRLRLDPLVVLAANYTDLAQRFADPGHLTRHYAGTDRLDVPKAAREQARALIDPAEDWQRLRAVPGGAELVASWEERGAALAAYRALLDERWSSADTALSALLHMHHNRLAGIDLPGEQRSLALARRSARARQGRAAARARRSGGPA